MGCDLSPEMYIAKRKQANNALFKQYELAPSCFCLFFFHFRLLITPLVSWSFSLYLETFLFMQVVFHFPCKRHTYASWPKGTIIEYPFLKDCTPVEDKLIPISALAITFNGGFCVVQICVISPPFAWYSIAISIFYIRNEIPPNVCTWISVCWSNRHKKFAVTTNWSTATKYPLLMWQWIFSILRRFFIPLSPLRIWQDLALWVRNRNVLPIGRI